MSGAEIAFYLVSGVVWTLAALVIFGWIFVAILGVAHIARAALDPNYPGERK